MRKLLIGLLAVALVLCGALLALVGPRHCPVNRAASERIKEGMTQAEVEQILGGPPGDYRTRPGQASAPFIPGLAWLAHDCQEWRGDEVEVWVGFDDGGRVESVGSWKGASEPATTLEVARWRLNRLLGHGSR